VLTSIRFTPARRRLLLSAAPAVAGLLLVSACGGSGSAAASSASSAPSAGSSNAPGGQSNGRFPGASGEIAAETGSTLQVQNTSSQTAVTFSSSTRITNTVAATAADVQVGMCAVARPATGTGNSAATATPSTTVAAATVVLSEPVNGSCTGGFGGFGGAGFGGGTGGFPSGFPSRAPRPSGSRSPGAGGFNRGAFGADGLISHINGGSFVVQSQRRGFGASSSPSSTASPFVTDITVTTSSSTKYSKTVTANSSALAVGECVTAVGKTDDTGAVASSTIAIEAKVNGSCSTGFGRRPGGFGGTNGAGDSSG
jgi:hypothetical protein